MELHDFLIRISQSCPNSIGILAEYVNNPGRYGLASLCVLPEASIHNWDRLFQHIHSTVSRVLDGIHM